MTPAILNTANAIVPSSVDKPMALEYVAMYKDTGKYASAWTTIVKD